jgi:hypothetical protein
MLSIDAAASRALVVDLPTSRFHASKSSRNELTAAHFGGKPA